MWELGPEHCCATCEHAEEELRYGNAEYSCGIQLDALDPNLALAVYVDPVARCKCYECNENKFFSMHGWRFDDPRAAGFAGLKGGVDYPGSLRGLPLSRM